MRWRCSGALSSITDSAYKPPSALRLNGLGLPTPVHTEPWAFPWMFSENKSQLLFEVWFVSSLQVAVKHWSKIKGREQGSRTPCIKRCWASHTPFPPVRRRWRHLLKGSILRLKPGPVQCREHLPHRDTGAHLERTLAHRKKHQDVSSHYLLSLLHQLTWLNDFIINKIYLLTMWGWGETKSLLILLLTSRMNNSLTHFGITSKEWSTVGASSVLQTVWQYPKEKGEKESGRQVMRALLQLSEVFLLQVDCQGTGEGVET